MAVRASWTLHHESAPTTGSLDIAPPTDDLNGLRVALEDARKQLNGTSSARVDGTDRWLEMLTEAKDAVGDREKALERAAVAESDEEDPEAP